MLRPTNFHRFFAASSLVLIPLLLVGLNLAGDREEEPFFSRDGHGAFMGVRLEEETEHPEGGARVIGVVEDSAAEDAGLQEGDIIVGFDGETVRGPMGLTKKIRGREPGDAVSLTIVRDGREQSLRLELGERKGYTFSFGEDGPLAFMPDMAELFRCDEDEENCAFSFSCTGDDCAHADLDFDFDFSFFGNRPMLGIESVGVTDELRKHLGGDGNAGVLISRIVENSPAEEAGIEVGDLLISVDGDTIRNVGDARDALRDTEGRTFEVEVVRDGRTVRIDVTMPEREDRDISGPRALLLELDGSDLHEVTREARQLAREAQESARNALNEALRAHRSDVY